MGGFYLFIRSPSFGKSEATWEYYIAVVTWILVVCRWIRCSYFKIFLSFCLISFLAQRPKIKIEAVLVANPLACKYCGSSSCLT